MNEMTMEWALELLQLNFNDDGGWLTKKNPLYWPTNQEVGAIVYLEDEWDYYYISNPQ